MILFRTFCALLLLLGAGLSPAAADTFLLASGGQLDGQLLNAAENPRVSYVVRTDNGVQLTLPADVVKRFVPESQAEKDYARLLPRMPLTAQGNWKMAEWCREQGLSDQRERHLREVIRLDANHKDARAALGYTSIDGRWVTTDEWNRERGFVYFQGVWRTPQEVVDMTTERQLQVATVEWRQKLKRWRGALDSDRRRDAAIAEIRAVRDPLAGPLLAEMYESEKTPAYRRLWVEVLGANPSAAGIDAVVKAAIEDQDRDVRELARDVLAELRPPRAVAALVAELRSKDNNKVNLAAAALGRIKDPDTISPLIDALVTEHKYMITRGQNGSIGAGFSPTGGSGFSAGGGPKLEKHKRQNVSVLGALVVITEPHHANFQYDQEAWRVWYSELHMPKELATLRRDE